MCTAKGVSNKNKKQQIERSIKNNDPQSVQKNSNPQDKPSKENIQQEVTSSNVKSVPKENFNTDKSSDWKTIQSVLRPNSARTTPQIVPSQQATAIQNPQTNPTTANEPTKGTVVEPSKTASKEPTKTASKEVTNGPKKDVTKGASKEPTGTKTNATTEETFKPPPPPQYAKRDIFGNNKKLPSREDPEYQTLYNLEEWDNNDDHFSDYVKLVEQTQKSVPQRKNYQSERLIKRQGSKENGNRGSVEPMGRPRASAESVERGRESAETVNRVKSSGEPLLRASSEAVQKDSAERLGHQQLIKGSGEKAT